ncbi:MAG: hypothetical protein HY905_03685 [Deltaproteobacteria bacterium]|nr:hypothetical protein [Deltaproteobacteria bacterium]
MVALLMLAGIGGCAPGDQGGGGDVRRDEVGASDEGGPSDGEADWAGDMPEGSEAGPEVATDGDVGADGDGDADGDSDVSDAPYDGETGWHAEIVSVEVPYAIEQGTVATATIVVRNTGTTGWREGEVKLGAVDDLDPLSAATRVSHAGEILPGGTATYSFTLLAPALAAPRRVQDAITDWRMVNDGPDSQWFGPTVRRHVAIYDASPVAVDGLEGKVLAGYQGWFTAAGAPADIGWTHWCRGGGPPDPDNVTFDVWPDLSEFPAEELYDTTFAYGDGSAARLFSSFNAATVDRHFRWMKEYGIDGVWLQRFASELRDPRFLALRDQVLRHVMAAAAAHGRAFGVMYDVSGMPTDPPMIEQLTNDWMHLVNDLGVTASPRYVREGGRPVLGLWGLGFSDRPGSHDDDINIILHLQTVVDPAYRVTIVGGVPEGWRTSTGASKRGYTDVYRQYAVLSPWAVGRYDDAGYGGFRAGYIVPDVADLGASRYLPVVFPGFSWTNLTDRANPVNQIPRLAGDFLWHQAWGAWSAGARMLFLAMFDEVDEGTAILKAAGTAADAPTTGTFLTLDADGVAVPNDWYLRLAGEVGNLFRGVYPSQPEKPIEL